MIMQCIEVGHSHVHDVHIITYCEGMPPGYCYYLNNLVAIIVQEMYIASYCVFVIVNCCMCYII